MSALHTLTITDATTSSYVGSYGRRIELEYELSIDCPGCDGWQECSECRDVPSYDDDSWGDTQDDEEREIHGVWHTWHWGWGWTTAFPGCVLRAQGNLHEWAWDICAAYGPGSYLVDDDWDDDDGLVSLRAVSLADGSPLPGPGWAARQLEADR